MKKKDYQMLSLRVIRLQGKASLLASSGDGTGPIAGNTTPSVYHGTFQ